MPLIFNGSSIPGSGAVKENGVSLSSLKANNVEVWKRQTDLWVNGGTGSSGGWANYYMANVSGQWALGTAISSNGYNSNTHFGTLCHTGNKINVKAGDRFSFYLSGTGSNTTRDTSGFLWNINLKLVLLSSVPSNPLPFSNLEDTGLISAPGKDVFRSGDQHYDWTYSWPVNNTTIEYLSSVTGSYYIGFLLWGYNAYCNNINLNNLIQIPA